MAETRPMPPLRQRLKAGPDSLMCPRTHHGRTPLQQVFLSPSWQPAGGTSGMDASVRRDGRRKQKQCSQDRR